MKVSASEIIGTLARGIMSIGLQDGHFRGEYVQIAGEANTATSVAKILGRGSEPKIYKIEWYDDNAKVIAHRESDLKSLNRISGKEAEATGIHVTGIERLM